MTSLVPVSTKSICCLAQGLCVLCHIMYYQSLNYSPSQSSSWSVITIYLDSSHLLNIFEYLYFNNGIHCLRNHWFMKSPCFTCASISWIGYYCRGGNFLWDIGHKWQMFKIVKIVKNFQKRGVIFIGPR